MNKTFKIILAVALIVIVPTGIYLGLALPGPVLSSDVNASGLFVAWQEYDVIIGFPKTQMQVIVEVTDIVALGGGISIYDSNGDLVESIAFSGTGTFGTSWINAVGGYNVTVYASTIGTASIEGHITIYARGYPFVS
jgi:hypothetical protein